jgi:tetratricopeptide (TPR) repeat protein
MSPKLRKNLRVSLLVLMILILLFFAFELIFSRHRILHSLASGLYDHGKFSLPNRIWNGLSDPNDGDDIPENSLARLNYKDGDHASAKDGFSDALQENAENPINRYNRGNAEYRLNDLDAALQDYKEAMLADPKDKDAKSNYELVLMRKGYKPPKQKPDDKEGQDPDKQQPKPEEQPQENLEKQQYNSILDALDQKEARDRNKRAEEEFPERDKWW